MGPVWPLKTHKIKSFDSNRNWKKQDLSWVSWTSLWYVTIIHCISTAVSPWVKLTDGKRETRKPSILKVLSCVERYDVWRRMSRVSPGKCHCSRGRRCSEHHWTKNIFYSSLYSIPVETHRPKKMHAHYIKNIYF